jgi:hypothetical protein
MFTKRDSLLALSQEVIVTLKIDFCSLGWSSGRVVLNNVEIAGLEFVCNECKGTTKWGGFVQTP